MEQSSDLDFEQEPTENNDILIYAATIIQKHIRGYLVRTALQEYFNQQQEEEIEYQEMYLQENGIQENNHSSQNSTKETNINMMNIEQLKKDIQENKYIQQKNSKSSSINMSLDSQKKYLKQQNVEEMIQQMGEKLTSSEELNFRKNAEKQIKKELKNTISAATSTQSQYIDELPQKQPQILKKTSNTPKQIMKSDGYLHQNVPKYNFSGQDVIHQQQHQDLHEQPQNQEYAQDAYEIDYSIKSELYREQQLQIQQQQLQQQQQQQQEQNENVHHSGYNYKPTESFLKHVKTIESMQFNQEKSPKNNQNQKNQKLQKPQHEILGNQILATANSGPLHNFSLLSYNSQLLTAFKHNKTSQVFQKNKRNSSKFVPGNGPAGARIKTVPYNSINTQFSSQSQKTNNYMYDFDVFIKSAIKIQAMFRGYFCRKFICNFPYIKKKVLVIEQFFYKVKEIKRKKVKECIRNIEFGSYELIKLIQSYEKSDQNLTKFFNNKPVIMQQLHKSRKKLQSIFAQFIQKNIDKYNIEPPKIELNKSNIKDREYMILSLTNEVEKIKMELEEKTIQSNKQLLKMQEKYTELKNYHKQSLLKYITGIKTLKEQFKSQNNYSGLQKADQLFQQAEHEILNNNSNQNNNNIMKEQHNIFSNSNRDIQQQQQQQYNSHTNLSTPQHKINPNNNTNNGIYYAAAKKENFRKSNRSSSPIKNNANNYNYSNFHSNNGSGNSNHASAQSLKQQQMKYFNYNVN